MTHGPVRLTTRVERETLRSIRRICHAGLDTISLRQEVARRIEPVVPTDACSLVATEPGTGLFTHGWLQNVPEALVNGYMAEIYPDEITDYFDLARSGGTSTSRNSPAFLDLLASQGLAYRARTALCCEGGIWGSWCMFRTRSSGDFSEGELAFLRAVAPHIGYGMRTGARLDAVAEGDGGSGATDVGVIVLDSARRITLRSGGAAAQLQDLASVGGRETDLPYALSSLLAWLRCAAHDPEGSGGASLRAQGRSGRWYQLRAGTTEPDGRGETRHVIVIDPVAAHPASLALSTLYGLTPRERDVLLLAMRGESNKQIGARLGLSAYTVQDHMCHACRKVGVRGRAALLAKLYRDCHAPVVDA